MLEGAVKYRFIFARFARHMSLENMKIVTCFCRSLKKCIGNVLLARIGWENRGKKGREWAKKKEKRKEIGKNRRSATPVT
jgi:hypothetical protein